MSRPGAPIPVPRAWAELAPFPLAADTHGWSDLGRALAAHATGALRGILENPAGADPERVLNYVCIWLCDEGLLTVDAEEPEAERAQSTLELLLACLTRADPAQRPLVLRQAHGPAPLRKHFASQQRRCRKLNTRLLEVVRAIREPDEVLGMLAYLLVMRAGLCDVRLVDAALVALAAGEPIRRFEPYSWINVEVDVDGHAQRRRVFVDEIVLGAWSACREFVTRQIGTDRGALGKGDVARLRGEAWSSFARVGRRCGVPVPAIRACTSACEARIKQASVPLLAGYAAGTVPSTSWEERHWQRLLGAYAVPVRAPHERRPPRDAGCEDDPGDAITRPIEEDAFLAQLRDATTHADRTAVSMALQQVSDALAAGSTRRVLTDWLLHLVNEVRVDGKPLTLQTINGYRGALAARMVGTLPEDLQTLTAEELGELFDDIVETASSPGVRARLCKLVRRFDAFRRAKGINVEGYLELPSTKGHYCDVSARFVTEAEYQRAMKRLEEGESPIDRESRVFLALAFRFGLRRAEVLGLTLADVAEADRDRDLRVRANCFRNLKTRNANRRLPLSLLSAREATALRRLWWQRKHAASPAPGGVDLHAISLFSDISAGQPHALGCHPAPRRAQQALQFATGDTSLHVHHLRHAFGTRHGLGALVRTLTASQRKYLPPFICQLAGECDAFHEKIRARRDPEARRCTAVSVALGHGSESITFKHYVHGLDVLLHAVMTSVQPARRARANKASRLRCVDQQVISALLGQAPTTHPRPGKDWHWMSNQLRRRGVRVELLRTGRPEAGVAQSLDIEWACSRVELDTLEGRPKTTQERAAALTVLAAIAEGVAEHGPTIKRLLHALADTAGSGGWTRHTPDDARELRHAFRRTFASRLKLEYRSAQRGKRRLGNRALGACLRRGEPLEVRIADPEASPERQRRWMTVLWALRAGLRWLELGAGPAEEVATQHAVAA